MLCAFKVYSEVDICNSLPVANDSLFLLLAHHPLFFLTVTYMKLEMALKNRAICSKTAVFQVIWFAEMEECN